MGCVKSTVCQWLRKTPLAVPELPPDGTLELDRLWTRTRSGRTELKVIRNAAAGTSLGAFGPWSEVIDRAWQYGAQHPAHRTTSRLERHNRELRRREQLGTVWTEHNLLALLQEQGLINQNHLKRNATA